MHDYGLAVKDAGYLPSNKTHAINSVFYTTVRDYTCNAYPSGQRRNECRNYAYLYYQAVVWDLE